MDDSKYPEEFHVGVSKEEQERVPLQGQKKKFQDKDPWTKPF